MIKRRESHERRGVSHDWSIEDEAKKWPDPSYVLSTNQKTGQQAITCLTCNRTSYNPNDIAEEYCGCCKKFH